MSSDKTKRRGHHEGTIYKVTRPKKDGSSHVFWQGQVTLPSGKRRTVSGKTRQEVVRSVAKLKRDVESGMYGTIDGTHTLREYVGQWIRQHSSLSETTLAGYRSIWRSHLDGIGDVKLDDVTPAQLQAHYSKKLVGRSPTTVRNLHRLIHVVLEEAVAHGILPRNPSSSIRGMKIADREMLVMRADEIPQFIRSAQNHRMHALWILAISTGMREAELLGLRWSDIDFTQRIVKVRQTIHRIEGHFTCTAPKSASSRRDLPLADDAAIAVLKWRTEQAEERRLCGDAWTTVFEDLVFTTSVGTPIMHDNILRQFHRVIRDAGLNEKLRVHDIRHTFATLLLERGVHVLIVSKLLGHSSVTITLRVYGHITLRMHDQARVEINQIIGSQDIAQPRVIEAGFPLLHDVLHDVMQKK